MDPIVAEYVQSDRDLAGILRSETSHDNAVATALQTLQEFLSGKRTAEETLRTAETTRLEKATANLQILFFGSWAEAACTIGRLQEAQVLVHRGQTLISNQTPPEISAYLLTVEGFLASCQGNKVRRGQILREVLRTLPSGSPRRQFHVLELAYLLARLGRVTELDDELRRLDTDTSLPFVQATVCLIRFINAVEIGKADAAHRLLGTLEQQAGFLDSHSSSTFHEYRTILELLLDHGGRNLAHIPVPSAGAAPPPTLAVSRCLAARRPDTALQWARLLARNSDRFTRRHGFCSLDLVRAELAAGNGEAARRILAMRQARGNTHFLDELFLARIDYLAANTEVAARHLATAMASIERYEAYGRLDLELRLACELRRDALVRLALAAGALGADTTRRERTIDTGHGKPPAPPPSASGIDRLAGRSSAIATIRETILKFAPLDVPVFITGETGTGKELVARALHEASPRKDRPFIAINCGAITQTLLESELFGHERGAFSGAVRARRGMFEEAADGTLFLDEIGDISNQLQLALLRVLETREIRPVGSSRTRKIECRLLFATNAELDRRAADNRFRKDLLFRLRRLEIHVPPLRERKEDVVSLADYFLDLDRTPGTHAVMTQDLSDALPRYDWPGNVRELRNIVERMRLVNSDKLLYQADDLDNALHGAGGVTPPTPIDPIGADGIPHPRPHDESVSRQPDQLASNHHAHSGPPAAEAARIDDFLRKGKSRLRRLDRLRALFAAHKTLTRSEVARILTISPNTATKDLKTLCNEQIIVRVEPSASSRSHYFRVKEPGENTPGSRIRHHVENQSTDVVTNLDSSATFPT